MANSSSSIKVVIIGGSGGIGQAFVNNLSRRTNVESVIATYNHRAPDLNHQKVSWHKLDITHESAIQAWAERLDDIDWLINAAGILHKPGQGPEKSIRQFDPAFFLENMTVNALPTLLLAKHCQAAFRHHRPAIFATVSARVGSIEDNRLGGWFSYRASKASLNMCLKTLAIEWRRSLPNVTVTALHPGTTDTALSRPFQKYVPKEQLFTPDYSVKSMLNVLDSLEPEDSGQFRAFDGEKLPW